MRNFLEEMATATRSSRAGTAWLSKAARRNVRQTVALAAETGKIHSVTLHGVVWTLRNPDLKQPKPPPKSADKGEGTSTATSRRAERSAKRLLEFQAARRFRASSLFQRWKRLTQRFHLSNLSNRYSQAVAPK